MFPSGKTEFFHPFSKHGLDISEMPGTIPSSGHMTFTTSQLGKGSISCRTYLRMLGGKEAIEMQANQRTKEVSVEGNDNILAWKRRESKFKVV